MLHEIMKQFVKDGYDVDAVAVTSSGETVVMDGITVYHGEEYRNIDLEPYDIIVTQFAESLYIPTKAKKLKKKIVYVVHNTMEETNKYLHREKPDLAIS